MSDNVNSPQHYRTGNIECIDAIEAVIGNKPGMEAYCVGNVVKYLYRYPEKGGVESVRKAEWYLRRLLREMSAEVELPMSTEEMLEAEVMGLRVQLAESDERQARLVVALQTGIIAIESNPTINRSLEGFRQETLEFLRSVLNELRTEGISE